MAWTNYNNSFADDKPQWNQAQLFCIGLHEINREIDECMKLQNLWGAYNLQKRVSSKINYLIQTNIDKVMFNLKYSEHMKNLEEIFKRIHQLLSSKTAEMNIGVISQELEKSDKILYWFQWDLNLIFPEKVLKDWIKEFKSSFE